jgi:two-component system sensor histidine kinase AlgZ
MEEDLEQISSSLQLPPLLLQPLIENAVTHGIANLPEGGTVRLSGHSHNGRVQLAIENTFDPDSTPMRKGGLGLRNVRERLEARYGKDANMRVSTENGIFRVNLSFPVDTQEVKKRVRRLKKRSLLSSLTMKTSRAWFSAN